MQQKATVPMIVVAVLALVGLMVYLGKSFMKGPGAATSQQAGYPSFIDPVTHKPKGQMQGSTPSAPGKGSMGAPGGMRPPGAPPGP